MIKPLKSDEIWMTDDNDSNCELWAKKFADDFRMRFSTLLGFDFRKLSSTLAIRIL